MNVISTPLPGLFIVEPTVFNDSRGYFFESYQHQRYAEHGMNTSFIQDNESKSARGVIRGLHYQLQPFSQTKLVRVIEGCVFDVAVDLRKNSPTFRQWFGVELDNQSRRQLYIPQGFAHGFSVLSETAVFSYKCDKIYNKDSERAINFDDPAIGINWRIDKKEWIISEKDANAPLFNHAEMNFIF
jgi:dTDP-4-dehydrorhamnose 3,5-epimerase